MTPFSRRKILDFFQCLDRNGNGRLEMADFLSTSAWLRRRMGWKDGDTRYLMVRASLSAWWERILKRLDKNEDGHVSPQEFLDFHADIVAQAVRDGQVPVWALEHAHALYRALDLDGDDQVSVEEYCLYLDAIGSDADGKAAFKRLDLNGDGYIGLDEVQLLMTQWLMSENPEDPGNWLVTGRIPDLA